jgi:hypothetical protein
LTSPNLGKRAIQKGDEVIGVAAGFPTTVNPLIQFGWSKEEGRHVFLGEKSKEESETRKLNELTEIAKEIFSNKTVLSYAEFTQAVMEALDIKERMARNYIKFMKDHDIIEKSDGINGDYSLSTLLF